MTWREIIGEAGASAFSHVESADPEKPGLKANSLPQHCMGKSTPTT